MYIKSLLFHFAWKCSRFCSGSLSTICMHIEIHRFYTIYSEPNNPPSNEHQIGLKRFICVVKDNAGIVFIHIPSDIAIYSPVRSLIHLLHSHMGIQSSQTIKKGIYFKTTNYYGRLVCLNSPFFPQFDYAACVIITINEMNANVAICLFLVRHINTNTKHQCIQNKCMYVNYWTDWLIVIIYIMRTTHVHNNINDVFLFHPFILSPTARLAIHEYHILYYWLMQCHSIHHTYIKYNFLFHIKYNEF